MTNPVVSILISIRLLVVQLNGTISFSEFMPNNHKQRSDFGDPVSLGSSSIVDQWMVEADLYNTGKHVIAVIFQQMLLSSIHSYQGIYHVGVDVNQEKKTVSRGASEPDHWMSCSRQVKNKLNYLIRLPLCFSLNVDKKNPSKTC